MPEERRSQPARPQSAPAATAGAALSAAVLRSALTPPGLFTNLFPVTFATGSLGALQQTTKAKKEDFEDRLRPRFYPSGEVLYAYGPGPEEFKDQRFTPSIVAPGSDPRLAQHLMKMGLLDFFRANGYLTRSRRVGISVIDHKDPIATAEKGVLHIFPEYTFQAFRLEGAEGTPIYAFSVEPSWATVPEFELGHRLAGQAKRLQGLKLVLDCQECGPHCPLHERLDGVVGVFEEFAEEGAELTSACRHEDYAPQPVRVRQRVHGKGAKRAKGKAAEPVERTVVLPGQVVKPASGQRRVLGLFHDRRELERRGKIWLGVLTESGKARSGALQVRYERIQRFLARVAGHPTEGLRFTLPTGPIVTLERVPMAAEELAEAFADA